MAVKLASLKANLEREAEGDWVDFPDWPGVAFKVSSLHKPAYRTALTLLLQRFARIYKGKPTPPEESAAGIGKLYCAHILHGWRGLDVAYSGDAALEVLCDPAYREVLQAVEWCAGKVGELQLEFTEESEKNSERPSAGSSAAKVKKVG